MKKVTVIGNFAQKLDSLDGQTIKTRTLASELQILLGVKNVSTIDTYNWKSNPPLLFSKCFLSLFTSKNIVFLPAQNGVKVLLPLLAILNIFFDSSLHYVVIGGWLPELIRENKKLKSKASRLKGIYVETESMLKALNKEDLYNVFILPNFKSLEILDETQLVYPTNEPLKLCTFSRVMKEKGIEDAVKAVKKVNAHLNRIAFSLDIYGQIDEKYKSEFEMLLKTFPDYVKYKGTVKYTESTKVLKEYAALLFPTYYEGEGFAGTIIDAFASGIPVVASKWRYNAEIISDGKDGFLYDLADENGLFKILSIISDNPDIIKSMKLHCLARAKQYTSKAVVGAFVYYLA